MVRYRLAIVVVLTSAAVLLLTALLRRWSLPAFSRPVLAGTALACALVAEAVPFFSHAGVADRRLLAHVVASGCVLTAAALLVPGLRGRWLAAGTAVGACAVWTVAAVAIVPRPRIDVWVTLQQAADGLAHGQNMYAMTWHDSPGIKDAFTYLPWTEMLLAPGRWLAGDVRWALLVWTLVGLGAMVALGLTSGRTSAGVTRPAGNLPLALAAVTLLALAPGAVTQAEQAWTEPLLLALVALWALLVRRGHPWWAVLPLALGCASKQHLVVLLPVLACWTAFGWRRALATGAAAGALVLPWFVAGPVDLWHDTVSLLVSFHPIKFANTWFIAAQTELGWTPPFYLTGLLVLGVLVLACVLVRRRQPGLPEVIGWLALVLLVANLVNKQAFYNQFWLVGALVALALAATPAEALAVTSEPSRDQPSSRETGSPASRSASR